MHRAPDWERAGQSMLGHQEQAQHHPAFCEQQSTTIKAWRFVSHLTSQEEGNSSGVPLNLGSSPSLACSPFCLYSETLSCFF